MKKAALGGRLFLNSIIEQMFCFAIYIRMCPNLAHNKTAPKIGAVDRSTDIRVKYLVLSSMHFAK